MKLSEVYLDRLELAKQWWLAADAAQDYEDKLHCRQNALCLQEDACAIAHCIASWGNQNIEQLDIDALRHAAAKIPWQYHNPWHQGLHLLQKEFLSIKL